MLLHNKLQKDYTLNQSGYQLKLPLELETIIPKNDSVRLLSQFVEEMDLTDDTYNALSEDSADNTLTDLDVSSAMDINIVGDNDINMLDSLDDFDNLDSDEINSSEE